MQVILPFFHRQARPGSCRSLPRSTALPQASFLALVHGLFPSLLRAADLPGERFPAVLTVGCCSPTFFVALARTLACAMGPVSCSHLWWLHLVLHARPLVSCGVLVASKNWFHVLAGCLLRQAVRCTVFHPLQHGQERTTSGEIHPHRACVQGLWRQAPASAGVGTARPFQIKKKKKNRPIHRRL